MKRRKSATRSRRGMALLVVLFIVMAIAVISAGFIARSDAAMLGGYNYDMHNRTEALAWGGLEHARALVISPENAAPLTEWSAEGWQLDADSALYYDLTIGSPAETANADPNLPSTYAYPVRSSAYKKQGTRVLAGSSIHATLFYDPNSTQAYYISLRRQ